jgi:hypothetical protein
LLPDVNLNKMKYYVETGHFDELMC